MRCPLFLRETCSWQKIDREDRGIPVNRECSPFRSPLFGLLHAHYALVIAIRPLSTSLQVFPFVPIPPCGKHREGEESRARRGERRENRTGVVYLFVYFRSHFLLFDPWCFPLFEKRRLLSGRVRESILRADYTTYLSEVMEIDLSSFFNRVLHTRIDNRVRVINNWVERSLTTIHISYY